MGLVSWAKGKALAMTAADQARKAREGRLGAEPMEMIFMLGAMWSQFISRATLGGHDPQPLDVLLQGFVLSHLQAHMAQAEAGLVPLTPSEIWLAVFSAVLYERTHDQSQLAAAIGRLEDRAAERR